MEILQKSKDLLGGIKTRIRLEERLINDPTPSNLNAFTNEFSLEKSLMQRLMAFVEIKINQNRLSELSSRLDGYTRIHRLNPLNTFNPVFIAIMALSGIVGLLSMFGKAASVEMAQIIPEEKNIYKALRRRTL